MGSDQRKFCFRMVEVANIDPRFRTVTRFAAQRRSIGALLRHAFFEFTFVWIHMAGCAGAVAEMERKNLVRSSTEAYFMAIRAGHRHMRPSQHETRVLVLGDGERRTMKVLNRVAILATVLVRRRGKLTVVRVLVAIRASREFHFVNRVLAGRRVTFVAGDGRMLSFERIVRCRVFLHAKLRRLPAFDGVAFRTLSLARPRLELSLVRIRRMTI